MPGAGTASPGLPQHIGRYRVETILGQGTFGVVYLAHDDQLHRPVAVKVAHRQWVTGPAEAQAYLAEARILAGLDHPHIVPVFDVGTAADGLPFVVSKLIQGSDLKARIKAGRPSFTEAAVLVAALAEALHHAHRNGLVHRDIKPANILLDAAGKPHLADFGLALKDEDFGRVPVFAGTPVYMSPEQARGEGHWVDGRSDIFSLGTVFYELLTGRRPFRGETREELLEQIIGVEARPPRQIDDTIPKELERICLKALAKRATDRYTTAKDMAEDLVRYLQTAAEGHRPPSRPGATGRAGAADNLLHVIWDSLDPHLQDAFALAYNKKRREGSHRISTRDLFQALVRVDDAALRLLLESLPEGALPEPVPAEVGADRQLLEESPLLSDCVEDSLNHFLASEPLPRKLSPVDLFVDIGKHGHGPSVSRLRQHGVTPEVLETQVSRRNLPVVRRKK
jgi:serine/threonine protein kinase